MILSSLHLFCLAWWIDLAISNPVVLNLRTSLTMPYSFNSIPLLLQILEISMCVCVFGYFNVTIQWKFQELFPVRITASRFGIQPRYNHKWLLQRPCKNYMWLQHRTEFEHTTRGMGVRRANPLRYWATNSIFRQQTLRFLQTQCISNLRVLVWKITERSKLNRFSKNLHFWNAFIFNLKHLLNKY